MNVEFLEALEEMAKDEGIERDDLYDAVAKGLKIAYTEQYGAAEDLTVKIDRNSGDIRIVADGVEKRIDLAQFGRIATRRAEEAIRQEITRKRREMIYERYHVKVGQLINGSVHRFEGGDVWLNLGQAEALLAEKERIPSERYRLGDQLKTYLYKVEKTQGDPRILVSRAHPNFVHQLLALEVPEIERGLVEIKAIAREAGVRSKVAVRATSPEIEPVGTCVGAAGSRVKEVVRELSGEKIDIIRWSEDLEQLIASSLEPASVIRMEIDEGQRKALVIVPDDELSLAIGRGGQNVRLTAKLTGYQIDVTSPEELAQGEQTGEVAQPGRQAKQA
jgi:N utilization substance protein A